MKMFEKFKELLKENHRLNLDLLSHYDKTPMRISLDIENYKTYSCINTLCSRSLERFNEDDYEFPNGLNEYDFMIMLYTKTLERILTLTPDKSTCDLAIVDYRASRSSYIHRGNLIREAIGYDYNPEHKSLFDIGDSIFNCI